MPTASSRFDLSNKIAFIPGGYGGIGAAIARGLAESGATVVIAGRSGEKAAALADEIAGAGFKASGLALDVEKVSDIRDTVDAIVKQHGGIDLLVNCVGMIREQPLLEFSEENYDEVYRVNQKAAMFLGQQVARVQVAAKRPGKHVHLLSVRSQLALRGRGYAAYCSTKGAQVMLVKQHAMELAPHGIRVNGIAPTFVYTDMVTHILADAKFKQALLDRIPLGRIADPEDIVGPTLFFCAPASDFVTGQIMYVDGGVTACQ